ncbi:MAG TPA: hypothetical protein ACFCUY_03220 [Xenococcaceae cyanobacterium]
MSKKLRLEKMDVAFKLVGFPDKSAFRFPLTKSQQTPSFQDGVPSTV